MPVTVVVGCQWGDEGKGKIVDVLGPQSELVCRYQGGSNAGHTVIIDDKKYVFHLLPSGVLHKGVMNLIGNGVVVDVLGLLDEMKQVESQGVEIDSRLLLSEQAHVILPLHKALDQAMEQERGADKIGTTGRGIGTAYADKSRRIGLRLCDFRHRDKFARKYRELAQWHSDVLKGVFNRQVLNLEESLEQVFAAGERILPLLCDSVSVVNDALAAGKEVLAEGAQGVLLDLDHGTYPFVTSSSPTPGGACTGLGISPFRIRRVIGIVKAYTTRVGEGPMPTELHGEEGERLRRLGGEFGATTGRPRRCGWLDLPILRRSLMISGCTELVITKLDVLDTYEELKLCTHYDTPAGLTERMPLDTEVLAQSKPVYESIAGWNSKSCGATEKSALPEKATEYLDRISRDLNTPISLVSTGPARAETIHYANP